MNTITYAEMIAEVERELAVRKNVYARWVKQGKTTQAAADLQQGRMQAVLEVLRRASVEMRTLEAGTLFSGEVYGPAKVRQDERARIMGALAPMVHTDVLLRLERKLAEPAAVPK